jgi:hypothetical protein
LSSIFEAYWYQLGKQNEFHFFVSMISIHTIKQALVLLIKLLIVGAAFILFTINWQIAMLSIGRSSLFCSRRIGQFQHYFHSAFECLESFF